MIKLTGYLVILLRLNVSGSFSLNLRYSYTIFRATTSEYQSFDQTYQAHRPDDANTQANSPRGAQMGPFLIRKCSATKKF